MAEEVSRQRREGLRSAASPSGGGQTKSPGTGADDWTNQMKELTLVDIEKQPKRVGFLYDERMLRTHNLWVPAYPENPERIRASMERCRTYGLVDRCTGVSARDATEEEVLLEHSKEYLELMKSSALMTQDELKELSMKYDGVYFHPATYSSALLAAGSAIEITGLVVKDEIRYGMALLRPPGHHAMRSEPCGYCFFNNAALSARHAIDALGLERVLLVDWDLHHGQGSQYMFYDDPRVLYFSIHRYEHGAFWPNLRESEYDYIGEGRGRGFNVNVPFNKVDMTDGDYMAIMQQILLPLAYEFNPQLVVVSCGFDAAIGDPEGRSEVTPACYAHFTHMMKALAGDHVSVLFEGGYCIKSLAEGVALTLRGLLDDPCPRLPALPPPMDSTVESILQVIRVLRPYWKCFAYHDEATTADQLPHFFRNPVVPKPGVEFFNESTRPEKFALDVYEDYSSEDRARLDKKIDALISATKLFTPPNRTCLVYDERMCRHKCMSDMGHPERPDRIRKMYSSLELLGLAKRCKTLESRLATEEELRLVHSAEWIERLRSYEGRSQEDLINLETRYKSIYLSQAAFECASLAVGSTLNVVDEVVTGKSRSGLAIVRPPGHHAEADCAMGFCYFNTVAIAARYSQTKHQLKRVLILDWDVHHGNGTQHTFEEDPSVLYISIHRRDYGSFFPMGDDNCSSKVGVGAGAGFNINIPWNKGGMGDAEYIAAFQQIVMPVAYQFDPDLVLVSAGFDAALGDPLGNCRVTPVGYGHMTHMLSSLAEGRVILVLEGGYNLNSISESMSMCASVLLGDRLPALRGSSVPKALAVETIKEVLDVHQQFWKSLAYRVRMPTRADTLAWLGHAQPLQAATNQPPDDSFPSSVRAEEAKAEVSSAEEAKTDVSSTKVMKETEAMRSMEEALSSALAASHITVSDASQGEKEEKEGVAALAPSDTASASGVECSIDEDPDEQAAGGGAIEVHSVVPLTWCPHLAAGVLPVPAPGLNTSQPCGVCGSQGENWVCLTCYEVHCSRFQQGHMVQHNLGTHHPIVLSYFDLSAWCYVCEAYVHNPDLLPAKNAAHMDKFQIPA